MLATAEYAAPECDEDPAKLLLLQSGWTLHPSRKEPVEPASQGWSLLVSEMLSTPALHRSAPLIAIIACMIFLVLACGLRQCVRHVNLEAPKVGVKLGVYAIIVTQTLNALATMVVLPTLPFFAMKLGASALEVSLMNSAYNLAQMFCSPLLGALSDRAGRKRVMLIGIFAQMLCNGFMTQSHTLMQLMLARMLVGAALSTGPVEMAYIMDFLQTEEELSRILALQRVMTSAGALAGPLVARTFDRLPFNSLCGGVVLINVINLTIGFFFWEDAKIEKPKTLADMDSEAAADSEERTFSENLYMMLSNHFACALLAVSFIYALGFAIGDGPEMVFFKDRYSFGKDQACMFYLRLGSVPLVSMTSNSHSNLLKHAGCKAQADECRYIGLFRCSTQ